MNRAVKQFNILGNAVWGNNVSRKQSWNHILNRIAKFFDTRVYDVFLTWHRDPEFEAIWADSPWMASDVDARKYTLFSLVKYTWPIVGDTIECGVYQGMSSYVILSATVQKGRIHHIFDSFQGLSEPSNEDCVDEKGVLRWAKRDLSASEELVRSNLAKFSNIHIYRGWIPERFEEVADRQFCLVHVDVDLYQPTLDAFEFFLPRLSPGGVIVCDDYGFSTCPGARKAVDEVETCYSVPVLRLPTGQALIIKP